MVAIDSNLLIYAHQPTSSHREAAKRVLEALVVGGRSWAIPYPCLHEFFRNVTDPRLYPTVTPADAALAHIASWLVSPTLTLLGEGAAHLDLLTAIALSAGVWGPMIHDARIAAICLERSVRELWTADRDFARFTMLATRNPLVGE